MRPIGKDLGEIGKDGREYWGYRHLLQVVEVTMIMLTMKPIGDIPLTRQGIDGGDYVRMDIKELGANVRN